MSNQFTSQDAQSLIALAQSAPLPGGMRQAQAVSELLQRFQSFYQDASAAPEAPKSRKSRKLQEETVPDAEDLTK